jgi:hypothetical protein
LSLADEVVEQGMKQAFPGELSAMSVALAQPISKLAEAVVGQLPVQMVVYERFWGVHAV